MNNSVAILYFTDENCNMINIPDGIVVYQHDNNNIIIHDSIDNSYPLCWTDSYTIELNNNVLIIIKNQRKWNIIS